MHLRYSESGQSRTWAPFLGTLVLSAADNMLRLHIRIKYNTNTQLQLFSIILNLWSNRNISIVQLAIKSVQIAGNKIGLETHHNFCLLLECRGRLQ